MLLEQLLFRNKQWDPNPHGHSQFGKNELTECEKQNVKHHTSL